MRRRTRGDKLEKSPRYLAGAAVAGGCLGSSPDQLRKVRGESLGRLWKWARERWLCFSSREE
jgi:hypothetical protein